MDKNQSGSKNEVLRHHTVKQCTHYIQTFSIQNFSQAQRSEDVESDNNAVIGWNRTRDETNEKN